MIWIQLCRWLSNIIFQLLRMRLKRSMHSINPTLLAVSDACQHSRSMRPINIISGEGSLLVINDKKYAHRAEIIREKGTNRSSFFCGEVR